LRRPAVDGLLDERRDDVHRVLVHRALVDKAADDVARVELRAVVREPAQRQLFSMDTTAPTSILKTMHYFLPSVETAVFNGQHRSHKRPENDAPLPALWRDR